MRAAVHLGAWDVPRLEYRLDRAAELLAGVLGEPATGLVLVDPLEPRDQLGQVVVGQVDVLIDAALALEHRELLLEAVAVDAVDRLAVHLDQPSVRVVGEAAVPGRRSQALDRFVVEPDVEDRVHHPRHRDGRARADGDEQRVGPVAETLAGLRLEHRHVIRDLLVQTVRDLPVGAHVGAARFGGDREPRRDGDAQLGHLGETDPLAAEQLAPAVTGLVEVVDVAHGGPDLVM